MVFERYFKDFTFPFFQLFVCICPHFRGIHPQFPRGAARGNTTEVRGKTAAGGIERISGLVSTHQGSIQIPRPKGSKFPAPRDPNSQSQGIPRLSFPHPGVFPLEGNHKMLLKNIPTMLCNVTIFSIHLHNQPVYSPKLPWEYSPYSPVLYGRIIPVF